MDRCGVKGCESPVRSKNAGLCEKHYYRLRLTGTTDPGPKAHGSLEARLWRHIDRRGSDECWPWKAMANKGGYGVIGQGRNKPPLLAHRAAWLITNGPIPLGKVIRHLCHNPLCCNPAHLSVGTQAENVSDTWARTDKMHGGQKLTALDVEAIRRDPRKDIELARAYGVSHAHISGIRKRLYWKGN